MRRLLLVASLALPVLGACTETNIAGPGTTSAAGVIVFASNRQDNHYEIFKIGADGRGLARLTNDPAPNDFAPVLSHDGRAIAWQREVADASGGVASVEIWVMNADGSNPHVVVRNGAFNESPSWTPDDQTLVFASDVSGNWDIFRVPAAGGAPVDLTPDSPFADQWPRVAPDGQHIVFQTNRDLDFEIYTMAMDGSGVRNLTKDAADDRFPAWTPDGTHILWTRYTQGSFDIWEMNADGTNPQAIVSSPFDDMMPSVSPDGRTLVFESNRTPPSSLWVVPLAGGTPQPLTGGPDARSGSDLQPWWGVNP